MGEMSAFSIRDSCAVWIFFNLTSCTYMNLFLRIIVLIVPEVSVKLVTSFNKYEGLSDMHFVSCPYY